MKLLDVEQNTPEWQNLRKGKILGSGVKDLIPAEPTKDEIVAALNAFNIPYPVTTPRTKGAEPKPKGTKAELKELLTPEADGWLMMSTEKKDQFYQLIADRIAIDWNEEYNDDGNIVHSNTTMMQRGHSLEDEAADMFEEVTGKKLLKVGIAVRDDDEDIGHSPDRLIESGSDIYTEELEIKCLKSAKHLRAYIEKKIPDEYIPQARQYFIVNDHLQTLYFALYDPRIPFKCKFFFLEIHRSDPIIADELERYLAYERLAIDQARQWAEQLSFE